LAEAKDNQNAAITFKTASLDQLWSCLQRCLLFEEPSCRWEKLISQVSRHVSGKARDLSRLTGSRQQDSFKTVFGTPADLLDLPSRTFNLVLAMQDLRRFQASDYDIWSLSQPDDKDAPESGQVFLDIAAEVLAAKPTVAQVAALAHSWNVVPYWRVLESCGPWSDDLLADFAESFLQKLDRMPLSLSVESALSAEAEFCKLLRAARSRLPGNFQPSLLVLVEGITETILLPRFLYLSSAAAHKRENRQEAGKTPEPAAMFIACGGANQLLRKYLHWQDVSGLPILCVVDHDATEQIQTIRDTLREIDHLHVWSVGEIEDTFSREFMVASLNAYLPSLGAADLLNYEDLQPGVRRTELLDRLWRDRGLGDFDKVGFAEFQVPRLKQVQDIPVEGRRLMETLRQMTGGPARK
jgi:hypothetical protein